MELRTEHVAAFVEVARVGSLTRCATAEGVSQSTLSRRLNALEASLGAQLFARGPAGLTLTAAGAAFLRHAPQVLEAADRAHLACGANTQDHGC